MVNRLAFEETLSQKLPFQNFKDFKNIVSTDVCDLIFKKCIQLFKMLQLCRAD